MNDQPTELFLRHLQSVLPGCQLALRLPGENHSYVFPEGDWRFDELDQLIESEQPMCSGEFGRLDILAWNPSPYGASDLPVPRGWGGRAGTSQCRTAHALGA